MKLVSPTKTLAIEALQSELQAEANLGGTVSAGGKTARPQSWLFDQLDDEIIKEAITAWLCGDMPKAARLFEAACEIAFEDAINVMADLQERT